MKNKTKINQMKLSGLLIVLVILLGSINSNAQEITLGVGDPAPPIKAAKWLKSKPMTELEKGKVHLVEFGATWCGGCHRMVPFLTNLSRKYRGKVNVISVFVMGFTRGPSIDEQEKNHFKSVEKYVSERSNRMKYAIAVDNAKQTIKKAWQNASGERGLPKLFLVDKSGRIVYIGSASEEFMSLLEDVVNDKHSLEKLIKEARKKEAGITS